MLTTIQTETHFSSLGPILHVVPSLCSGYYSLEAAGFLELVYFSVCLARDPGFNSSASLYSVCQCCPSMSYFKLRHKILIALGMLFLPHSSERVAKTGTGGTLLTEAIYINLSLHYLEQVYTSSWQPKWHLNCFPTSTCFQCGIL